MRNHANLTYNPAKPTENHANLLFLIQPHSYETLTPLLIRRSLKVFDL